MKNTRFLLLVVLICGLAVIGFKAAASAPQNQQKEVEAATAEFYSALGALFQGETKPMEEAWSHADDVTYMGPDGAYLVGWEAVSANWKKQAEKKLGGEVHPENTHINAGSDLAVVHCYEKGKNTNAEDGKPVDVSIRATSVFRKENGKWKMIGHHTDELAFLKK